jgi:hypothetical protein
MPRIPHPPLITAKQRLEILVASGRFLKILSEKSLFFSGNICREGCREAFTLSVGVRFPDPPGTAPSIGTESCRENCRMLAGSTQLDNEWTCRNANGGGNSKHCGAGHSWFPIPRKQPVAAGLAEAGPITGVSDPGYSATLFPPGSATPATVQPCFFPAGAKRGALPIS